jgi:hypothetical protein
MEFQAFARGGALRLPWALFVFGQAVVCKPAIAACPPWLAALNIGSSFARAKLDWLGGVYPSGKLNFVSTAKSRICGVFTQQPSTQPAHYGLLMCGMAGKQ